MVTKQKITGRASTMSAGLGYAAVISTMLTVILAAIVARLISDGYLKELGIGYSAMAILSSVSFCCAWISMKKIKRRKFMVCILSGNLYYVILMGITALFFGGQYEAVGVTWILVMGGSVFALVCGTSSRKEEKGRKWKIANR